MAAPKLQHETKPKRRRYQFSLRTLLIVVTLCSLPMAWFGHRYRQSQSEKKAIAWVTEQGGRVGYGSGLINQWFPSLVRSVNLRNTAVGDLAPLTNFTKLRMLDLHETQVSDLSPLAKLTDLEVLWLYETQVKDLSPLAELTNLKNLSLVFVPVRDLSPLSKLENLKFLNLNYTPVKDPAPLVHLVNLESLHLSGTQVSHEQIQMLKRAIPDCDIESP